MKLVYIAGPYTLKPGPIENTKQAIYAGDVAAGRGYAVFIPHLSLFWDMFLPHDYEFWMSQDLAILVKCDFLIRLEGESSGADREVELARKMGIQVFRSPFDLPLER